MTAPLSEHVPPARPHATGKVGYVTLAIKKPLVPWLLICVIWMELAIPAYEIKTTT
jgi:hypothetical protein